MLYASETITYIKRIEKYDLYYMNKNNCPLILFLLIKNFLIGLFSLKLS